MASSQFESARLKIKRAYWHIQGVEEIFQAFLKTDFCRLIVETDPQSGDQLIKIVSIGSPPAEISLAIGDAVHNLRSALDHAIVAILGKKHNRAAFPLVKNRDNPGAHPTYGIIKKSLPELAALLNDEIGIHDTGEPCLWAISALDNIDKHNLLIASTSVQELRGICLEDKVRNNRITNISASLDEGGVVNMIRYGGGGMKVTSKGQPAAAILFAKGAPLEDKPVIPSLLKLAELSFQAIETLELFWFGQQPEGAISTDVS